MYHSIRVSTKAFIFKDDNILLVSAENSRETYYMLPGGGQEHFETLEEALVRECMEEVGVNVKVGELRHVREFMGDLELGKGNTLRDFHQVEFFFDAQLLPGEEPRVGDGQDPHLTGWTWMPISQLHTIQLYPNVLVPLLQQTRSFPLYLGKVN